MVKSKLNERVVLSLTLLISIFAAHAAGLTARERMELVKSTVYIECRKFGQIRQGNVAKDTVYGWFGSGCIVSRTGYILTNGHVGYFDWRRQNEKIERTGRQLLLYEPFDQPDEIQIHITEDPTVRPQLAYFAGLVEGYNYWELAGESPLWPDLALLECRRHIDMREIRLGEEVFDRQHRIGDSDKLEIEDVVTVLGFPGAALGALDVVSGKVRNVQTELDRFRRRVKWAIGVTNDFHPGNSGGACVNKNCELIGLPTWSTNPQFFGGQIKYITPINQAHTLLARWVRGSRLGTFVSGRILNARTETGVSGAYVYIIWPDVNMDQFLNLVNKTNKTQDDWNAILYCIYCWTISTTGGRFSLPHGLVVGENITYPMIVIHPDYREYINRREFSDDRARIIDDYRVELSPLH